MNESTENQTQTNSDEVIENPEILEPEIRELVKRYKVASNYLRDELMYRCAFEKNTPGPLLIMIEEFKIREDDEFTKALSDICDCIISKVA